MKLGITIRPDMGDNYLITDSYALIEFLEQFKGRIQFIEIYCVYPLPYVLEEGLSELKAYCLNAGIDINLHFPVEWRDRWLKKHSYSEVKKLLSDFAREVDAKYLLVHPGDLVHFLGFMEKPEYKDEAMAELKSLVEEFPSTVVVSNGVTIFEQASDLHYFAEGSNFVGVNMCHIDQAVLPYEEFRSHFDGWGQKLFMFHLSDNGERPHMALGDGLMDFSAIIPDLLKQSVYGVCLDTLSVLKDELVVRHPLQAILKSLDAVEAFSTAHVSQKEV